MAAHLDRQVSALGDKIMTDTTRHGASPSITRTIAKALEHAPNADVAIYALTWAMVSRVSGSPFFQRMPDVAMFELEDDLLGLIA